MPVVGEGGYMQRSETTQTPTLTPLCGREPGRRERLVGWRTIAAPLVAVAASSALLANLVSVTQDPSLPIFVTLAVASIAGLWTSWLLNNWHALAIQADSTMAPVATDTEGNRIRAGLVGLTKMHDEATYDHSSWLAETALRLGAEMGLHGSELERLRWAALLHDLGKIAVSKATLTKAGRLTEEELLEIRRHPTIGADLIAAVLPDDVALSDAVRHHHERWDGCGYPAGLRGTDIPVASRIVAVVDVFEALTSDRAYRSALSLEQAAVYIRDGSGSHFDPDIVNAFLGILATGLAIPRSRAEDLNETSDFIRVQRALSTTPTSQTGLGA